MKKAISFILIALLPIGCNVKNAPLTENPPSETLTLTPIQKSRVSQDNQFSFELLQQMLQRYEERNLFVSPLSISIALGMLRNGAIAETKAEIDQALQLTGLSDEQINAYYRLLLTTLPAIDSKVNLSIANSIWYREGFQVKPDFLQTNTQYFHSEITALDFADPKTVEIINRWCSNKTNGLITKVLNFINPEQLMFLINAIYFKGMWLKQFDKQQTMEILFTNELNQQTTVNMMVLTDTFGYAEDDYAQYLEMPYGNGSFSMTVILPKETAAKADFSQLTSKRFNQAMAKMANEKVTLQLPRFKIENKFELKSTLHDMGMQKAFASMAEFDNISELKPLFVGSVKHDTYIEVTEEGTEAAAVTTIGIETTALPTHPYFIANKPFAFVIKEKSSGIILFIGKVGDPKKH